MKHPQLVTTPEVSRRMSKVKLKKGKAERMLAHELWHRGVRYRLNYKVLPGSPDIAITKHKVAIFVDGEFWHGHDWENRKSKLKRNRDYWIEKIEENMSRDRRNDRLLKNTGWLVIHFWEKDILSNLEKCVEHIMGSIDSLSKLINTEDFL